MKKRLLMIAVAAAVFPVQSMAAPKKLTLERLYEEPSLSGPALRGAKISPDGKQVTILKGREDDARQLDLWSYDLATGDSKMLVSSTDLLGAPEELSEEEKNRRERQRIYQYGIVSYQWDSNGEAILFPLGGDVFLYDLKKHEPVRVTETEGYETDPKVSPGGGYVSYVRDNELYVYDLATKKEKKLTAGANDVIRNATASFVVQEELDRDTGYWQSPDDKLIAYTQIDESPVKISERLDMGPDGAYTVRQRYPFAGTDNVLVKLGVVKAGGGRTTWVDLGDNPDIYLANAHWSKDGSTLYVERLSRDQKTLDLLKVDPKTGKSAVILTEHSDVWVNLKQGFRALEDGGFLWASERTGFNHIYKYDADGKLVATLTSGDWPVSNIACVDEAADSVYFTGWTDSVLNTNLYKTSLAGGGAPERVTKQDGRNSASFPGKDCSAYIGYFTSETQPYQVGVYSSTGERLMWLNENKMDESHPYYPYLASHQHWEYGELKTEDGVTLEYKVLKPKDMKKGEKRPAIVLVYGGPHAQTVSNSWSSPFEQLLSDQGYVLFRLDNRGAAGRGTAFEFPLYHAMGGVEVKDQAVGARWLAKQSYVDAKHIGVYGWSYGGYMTVMMLSQNPELYAAGVAGAPVTDWRLYDTAYTERYMGDPRTDGDAYDKSAVFAHLDGMKDGKMLLLHGMADDNVIFLNSVRLMDALQKDDTKFELMTFPGEKHGFRQKEKRLFRDQLILDYFARKLH